MRTTQAARYARWSAAVAMLLVAFVAGAYVRRAWQARLAREMAPSAVPPTIRQQSAQFSYSKVTGDRTEFTVRAAHATEFTEGGRILLEDVWVTFYGTDGMRADNLHTRTCEFLNSTGKIVCAGAVQIDLQSADDARLFPAASGHSNPGAHIAHINTSQVSFDRATGVTSTDQVVTFRFPQGQGRAVGLRYESQKGEMRLLRDVDFTFLRSALPGDRSAAPALAADSTAALAAAPATEADAPDAHLLHVTSSSLLYNRDAHTINLQGPVTAQQGQSRLLAGRLAFELDSMMRTRHIVASDQPKLNGIENGEPVSIAADELSALLSADGWIERMIAAGHVHANAHGAAREDRLDAGRAVVEMTARTNQARQLTASQSVVAESAGPDGLTRRLATSTLDLNFAPDGDNGLVRVTNAVTPPATLDWRAPADPSGKTPAEHMHMSTQHLEAVFGATGEVREVRGTGGVEVERQIGNASPQISTSREMIARLQPGGDWSSVDQTGDVRLREMDRIAQADAAHLDRQSDTAALSGSVVLSDAQSRLTARSATFHQLANEFHAEGHVVTNEVSPGSGGASNLAPAPARISADRLLANRATGHATYTGQARLWQGDSIIEADSIELDRSSLMLTANGHVRAVFPQASWVPPGDLIPSKSGLRPSTQSSARPAAGPDSEKPEFLRAEAGRLTYWSGKGQAHLEQQVITHSGEGSMQADAMDLYFAPVSTVGAAVPAPSTKAASGVAGIAQGPQQLVRAKALGNVVLQEEDRHGTSSQADYTAAEGKFVLSGGPPIVHDSSGNSTTGRQLTLFFADDRIVIDSAEGSRTLTLHRVEK